MVAPITQWDPALLRQIGLALCVVAMTVLGTHHIPNLRQNQRLRFLLSASIVLMLFEGMDRFPVITELTTIAIAAGAVVIPLVVCARTFWLIVSTE